MLEYPARLAGSPGDLRHAARRVARPAERRASAGAVSGWQRKGEGMRYVFGDYTLDVARRELRCRGHAVPLRPQVFDLLVYLVTHHDRAVAKQELLTQLWPNLHVSLATLSACIKLARQAVGDSGAAQRVIQTLHGRGYRFVARVEEASASAPEGESYAAPLPCCRRLRPFVGRPGWHSTAPGSWA